MSELLLEPASTLALAARFVWRLPFSTAANMAKKGLEDDML
jgi:hypothetical protein